MKIFSFVVAVIMFVFVGNVSATYVGSISTADGSLTGTGVWVSGNGSTLSWEISQEVGYWHYKYNLVVPEKQISHMIIEVSCNFTCADAFNKSGAFDHTEVGCFSACNGNPGMPGFMKGLKFDDIDDNIINLTVEFNSRRIPVWGDFYSKDGKSYCINNAVWNTGFCLDDPEISAHNGSEANHILVPDTIIPEPATIAILGLGSLLLRRK